MIHLLPVSLLDWLITGLVLLLVLVVLFGLLRRLWRGNPKPFYQQRPLLSADAATALQLLEDALEHPLRIFAHVSLEQLLNVNPALSKGQREQAQLAIHGEHLDFVFCSTDDFSVKLVVVLTNDTLNKKANQQQQQLLAHIEATGIAVMSLSPNAWPSRETIYDHIQAACEPTPPIIETNLGQGRIEPTLSLPDSVTDAEPDAGPKIDSQ